MPSLVSRSPARLIAGPAEQPEGAARGKMSVCSRSPARRSPRWPSIAVSSFGGIAWLLSAKSQLRIASAQIIDNSERTDSRPELSASGIGFDVELGGRFIRTPQLSKYSLIERSTRSELPT